MRLECAGALRAGAPSVETRRARGWGASWRFGATLRERSGLLVFPDSVAQNWSVTRHHAMDTIYLALVGAATIGVFIWLFIPSSSSKPPAAGGELIDPSDPSQIGWLVGLAGGEIEDAALATFALQRFEQIHGRKATTEEVAVVLGLMSELKKLRV